MRYEYGFKEYIRDEILSNINHMNILDEALEELDRVYAQDTKADEYEAKAKAFDNLVDVAYWHFERIHPDDDNGLQYESFYKDIRDEFRKYESGESDA